MNGGLSLKERGLKLAAKVSNSGAKVYLLYRVRELFKKIQKINEKGDSIDEKDGEIVKLLGETEEGQTKPNIELFGPKPYLVDKDLTFDKGETEVSILNYLPQFKTNCLETIGKDKLDTKMTKTIEYLSKDENRRVVALIATKIKEKYPEYPGLAGFTHKKVDKISDVCHQQKGDGNTHVQIERLKMNLLIGANIYEDVKKEDKEQERKNSKDSSAGGKRKTKRKRRKSKKSSRKKRKTRRSKK